MITENLSTLKINKLTQEQYDREKAAGNIDQNALYLTPDEEVDLSNFVTLEQLNNSNIFRYKGSIPSGTSLTVEEKTVGDVWFVVNENRFYMWNGSVWQPLSHNMNYKGIVTAEEFANIIAVVGDTYIVTHENGRNELAMALSNTSSTVGTEWFKMPQTSYVTTEFESLWAEIKKLEGLVENSGGAGADGITPHIGANGNWFIGETDTGVKAQGEKGNKGDPYTLTDTDKAAIVSDVLTALGGAPVFGYVDGDNTIVVSGNLASGEYTVKYEMEDGTTVDIGTLTLSADEPDEPVASFTNQIPISTDASGNLFVGENGEAGYKSGYRLSMSAGTEKAETGYSVTGFIPAKNGDVLRIKNITVDDNNYINIAGYDANKQPLNGGTTTYGTTLYNVFVTKGTSENGVYTATIAQNMHLGFGADLAYIRIGSTSITDESILTVNQEIV